MKNKLNGKAGEAYVKSKNPVRPPSKKAQQTNVKQETPLFSIQRIYMKNSSFDMSSSSTVFQENWKPQLDLQIQNANSQRSNGEYEAILKITLNCKSNNESVFVASVQQAGIFTIQHFQPAQVNAILGGMCLNILFPYVREAISDLVSRATLPLLYLAPINFDQVYAQSVEKRRIDELSKAAQQ